MNAAQSRRLAQLELNRRARLGNDDAPLLAWLATPESRATLEAAAAGEVFTVTDDVRRAGQRMVNALYLRRRADIETMTRAELAALVVSGA